MLLWGWNEKGEAESGILNPPDCKALPGNYPCTDLCLLRLTWLAYLKGFEVASDGVNVASALRSFEVEFGKI